MSLNIHIELHDGRFSPSQFDEVRQQTDQSSISSSTSNPFIEKLFASIEYYCHEVNQSAEALRCLIDSSTISANSLPILEDLLKGCQIFRDILHHYHCDRALAMQSLLSNPFREDAWRLVHELDSNMFSKCRIILFRLRISFLLMHQIITSRTTPPHKLRTHSASLQSLTNSKKRRGSSLSLSHSSKHG